MGRAVQLNVTHGSRKPRTRKGPGDEMNGRMLTTSFAAWAGVLLLATGCTQHKIDTASTVDVRPIEVKPIHITVDVNVRIDRQLDQFFAFEEEVEKPAPPATAPAAALEVRG